MSRPDPKISIVIPTFNRGRGISKAIESALSQDWPSIELIIVDDCSTDNTWDVVETYLDSRVIAIRLKHNRGGGGARNVGIDLATGSFVAFLDCDDYWLPQKLSRQMATIAGRRELERLVVYNRISLVIGDRIDHKPLFPWDEVTPIDEYIVPMKQPMQTSGLLVSAPLAKSVRFDDSLRKHQDIDFVVNLAKHGAAFQYCAAETVFYENSTLASRVSTTRNADLTLSFLRKWHGHLSRRTVAFYLATVVSPMLIRTRPMLGIRYLLESLPESLMYIKDVAEGFILWNVSEKSYGRLRRLFRKIAVRRT